MKGEAAVKAKETLIVAILYVAVSFLIFSSGFIEIAKVSDLSVLPAVVSLVLLVPLFFWYKRHKQRRELSSVVEVDGGFVWVEVLGLFLAAMAVRVPMVLVLGMSYEKTAVVYLVVLTAVLIKKNSLDVYGFRTERFARSLGVGLAYYLVFAVPLFATWWGLAYIFTGKTVLTGYNPLPDLFIFPFMTLCVGVSEEGLFRGFMQTRLAKVYSRKKALWSQASLFGLWHFVWHVSPFNPFEMTIHVFTTFIFGLVFGYFYQESGNLVPLVLTHGLVDTVGTGAVLNPELENAETLVQSLQAPAFAVAMIILALCTKFLARKARVTSD